MYEITLDATTVLTSKNQTTGQSKTKPKKVSSKGKKQLGFFLVVKEVPTQTIWTVV